MILSLLEFYEKYDYLFAIILPIITGLIGYFSKKYTVQLKKKRLNKILRLKNETIEILIPIRYGKLTLSSEYGATEIVDSYVTKREMDAAILAKDMFDKIGVSSTISNSPSQDNNNNIFCIGGPLSNINTANYFRDTKLFKPISFSVPKGSHYVSNRNRMHLSDLVHENDSTEDIRTINVAGCQILNFQYKHEGYIFLAKLSGALDFDDPEHGTVHICFGDNSETTYAAITSYCKYIKKFNKMLKKKEHYCLLIKCDKNGNINFNHCKDITDTVLVQNTADVVKT